MRLLRVDTFELEDFTSTLNVPEYAILSHTWDGGEVSFQDIADLERAQGKAGFQKIRYICEQAQLDGLSYAWVDTCCIDKNSSHELSEAINSMYRWYMNATVCYVYLSDVPGYCPQLSDDDSHPSSLRYIETLEDSRWFTRGWTLQELIAPRFVHFFGQSWNYIGSLPELIRRVSGITTIQIDVLDGSRPLRDLTIAERLSWAARRKTTRLEDEAYSLFGILNVNMPLLYGEGSKAFLRLQEEIIRQSTDQSIFAWDSPAGFIADRELLLAPSPKCFLNGSRIRRRRGNVIESAFRLSNKGLEITLPIMEQQLREDPALPYVTLGILDCKYEGSPNVLALVMKQHPLNFRGPTPALELYVSGYERCLDSNAAQYGRIITLKPRDIANAFPRNLTITKDLRSQTYIQNFSTNNIDSFPIRFTGDSQKHVLTVGNVYPEECWYETSHTMRLRTPEHYYGGIVVHIQESKRDGGVIRDAETKYILVSFGVYSPPAQNSPPSRKVYAISYIDPACPVEHHLRWLAGRGSQNGVDAAGLRLNGQQRLVAQLWNGALTVSIENSGDARTTRTSSIQSLTPPTSPIATTRQPSFSNVLRRDSLFQDDHSERSDNSQDYTSYSIHRTRQCENCRDVRAKWKADCKREDDERRHRLDEAEANRRKAERQKSLRTGVKRGAAVLSVGGVLADVAEFMV